MDQNLSQQKWEAKVSSRVERARADQIWPLFEDFFGIHKWFPSLSISRGIYGANGEPDCIRYCELKQEESVSESSSDVNCGKERLVAIDPLQMTLTYELVDSNIGFGSYIATIKVVPGDEGDSGCAVEWGFSVDPVAGWKLGDLVGKYEVWLQLVVRKMEAAIFESS